jgi:hypothetical protein
VHGESVSSLSNLLIELIAAYTIGNFEARYVNLSVNNLDLDIATTAAARSQTNKERLLQRRLMQFPWRGNFKPARRLHLRFTALAAAKQCRCNAAL